MSHKYVPVIGAGLGGLSAAIHLKARGYETEIFERNAHTGGKMSEWQVDGYRFDTGPSLLTMPEVIDELFAAAGKDRRDYLEFTPVAPVCRYFWPDGSMLDASTDMDEMIAAIAKISPRDAANYPAFMSYCQRIHDLTAEIFLHTPIHEWRKVMKKKFLPALFNLHRIDPLRNMHNGVRRFFSDPRIVQLFDRFATYNGSSPYLAPATLNIIPYVEHGLGGYYIRGGMYQLAEALTRLATEMGIRIHTNTEVTQIIVRDKHVKGLVVNGEFINSSQIVCNGDVVTSFDKLIAGYPRKKAKLNRLEPSLSGMVFMWGVERESSQLAHHNIFFSDDYKKEFQHIFEERRAPDDPTVYVAITARTDATHAPAGCENWFVLLNMPYLQPGQDWPAMVEKMREAVISKLLKSGIDLRGKISREKILTPEDFYQLYGSNRGSIYGISSNGKSNAFLRPANRSRDIEGMYFAGGSTHPGGGIPLVLLSGKMTAALLNERNRDAVEQTKTYEKQIL